jgi:hypothetical protein
MFYTKGSFSFAYDAFSPVNIKLLADNSAHLYRAKAGGEALYLLNIIL